jgi:hypothetical protein
MPPADTLTLWLDDLVITRREVTIAATCPACGVSLVAEAPERTPLLEPPTPAPTLVHDEYQAQARAAVALAGGEVDDALGDLPESADAYLSLAWSCAACGALLAEARHDERPSPAPPA